MPPFAGPMPSSLCVATQGPGMGGPLVTCAVVARLLSQIWGIPLVRLGNVPCYCHRQHCTRADLQQAGL